MAKASARCCTSTMCKQDTDGDVLNYTTKENGAKPRIKQSTQWSHKFSKKVPKAPKLPRLAWPRYAKQRPKIAVSHLSQILSFINRCPTRRIGSRIQRETAERPWNIKVKSIAFAEIYCDKSEIYCARCVCKVIISLCVKKDAVCEDDAVKDDECEREQRYENKELRRRARRAEDKS